MGRGTDVRSPVEELVFEVSDPAYAFVKLSEGGGRVALRKMLYRGEDRYAEFFSVEGVEPDRVLRMAEPAEEIDPSVLAEHENGGLFEFVVDDGCPAGLLAKLGALPREIEAADGVGQVVSDVPPGHDAAEVTGRFLQAHEAFELVAKQEKDVTAPLFSKRELEMAVEASTTERQREILRACYEAGYYERPREKTGTEIADDLGISSATFSQHLRAAERNLLDLLYQERTL